MLRRLLRRPQPPPRVLASTSAFPPRSPLTSLADANPDDLPFTPIRRSPPPPSPRATGKDQAHRSERSPLQSDLPFDFRYSYSEADRGARPIAFREPPRFSPFGPGRLDRAWNGVCAPAGPGADAARAREERDALLGEPLTDEEVRGLVQRYRHADCARQINLGKGGVTHNMIDDIHNHWKRAEAVRIKCLGVPTLDMDNVCFHLEDKTGGKIIYQNINILLLYRGRHYDPKRRPIVPLMLWKPLAPIYPKLVKNVADGLTFEETKEMRNLGLNSPALMKLSKREMGYMSMSWREYAELLKVRKWSGWIVVM